MVADDGLGLWFGVLVCCVFEFLCLDLGLVVVLALGFRYLFSYA